MSLVESFYSSRESALSYERLSAFQDRRGLVEGFLRPFAEGRSVLDAGCGTGRFLPFLESASDFCVGADGSPFQLSVARSKHPRSRLVRADLAGLLPWATGTFDTVLSAWVSGTVADPRRAAAFLENLAASAKPGGAVLLVENAPGSEFESIRGRDADGSTLRHHRFLEAAGFSVAAELGSSIDFPDLETARLVFSSIWGPGASSRICDRSIGHGIVVFTRNGARHV